MTEKKSILLRLNAKMWEDISKWAEDEFRSVNGQIEYLISEALRKRSGAQKKAPVKDEEESPDDDNG